ncbi:hypothetical protein QFC22_005796 [Naganishia vaughanmartiniae]|uniref:Uncharacterized protein n=1 Tax=Naganishia vaughanmartiniae TaxID=1424756 RepID=A0ACC2WQC8_9TREE|nr:hypothetical protein QFC22_005796 [Naganishia vaughanmartiniae]
MAAETVQLGLIALTSAPVIQTVFQHFQSDPKPQVGNTETQPESTSESQSEAAQQVSSSSNSNSNNNNNTARESPRTVSRTIAEAQTLTSTMPASSPPFVLAPPLPVEDERTLFIQNALHSGNFHSASAVSPISPQLEKPSAVEESQTASLDKDNASSPFDSQTPKETTQQQSESNPNEMGLLSVITGNIVPPTDMPTSAHRDGSNGHGIISNDIQANTVGPTAHRSMVRSDTVKSGMTDGTTGPVFGSHGGALGVGHSSAAGEQERSVTPTQEHERSVTPTPMSARTTEERAVSGPVSAAGGDVFGSSPVGQTGDRVTGGGRGDDVPAPLAAGADHAELQTEGGIEKGVPAHVGADGVYEGVGKSSEGNLSRPPLGDDQPSRSYVRRPESVVGTGNNTTNNGSIRDGGSPLSQAPRSVDYATASPANLGHPEKEVISLPAGGALHHGAQSQAGGEGQMSDAERREMEQQAENEKDQQRDQQPEIRQQLNEGQAYRADGSVPDQPQQHNQYAQYAAPLAGAGVAGAAAYGVQQHHHQQQQQMHHQQQQVTQQYNQIPQPQQHQQQQHMNDQSFAAERAMSPGPNQMFSAVPTHMQQGQRDDPSSQMSRLSFQDPAQQQQQQQQYGQHGQMNGVAQPTGIIGGVGPSPGPPVNAFAPTSATSPARRTPEPRGSTEGGVGVTGLARNSTMRSTATGGLSRGSTLRRGGAFANGAALQGAGVGEAFGRDDIHARTAGADRSLMGASAAGQAGMHRISKDEARDAKRISKMIKVEGKSEAAAVKGAIRELESLQKVQRAAHAEELKAQQKHAKFTRVEHKARLRFLKEKERYERVEAQLRSIEADYEAKREHASQQTDLLAEKTQELNDLRAQKAADDRERELKLLSLKNPGHA